MDNRGSRLVSRACALVLLTASGAACSSQDPATTPGDSVLVSGANHVVFDTSGVGFGPAVPAAASCHLERSYDLAVATGNLTWSVCKVAGDPSDPASYAINAGTRTLTPLELTRATSAIRAITVSDRMNCGADLDARTLSVQTPSGKVVYGDDFYACNKQFEHYVIFEQLQSYYDVLRDLVP